MNHLKPIALTLALILTAYAIFWALSSLAEIEAAKSDDYQIIIWLTPEPLKGSE